MQKLHSATTSFHFIITIFLLLLTEGRAAKARKPAKSWFSFFHSQNGVPFLPPRSLFLFFPAVLSFICSILCTTHAEINNRLKAAKKNRVGKYIYIFICWVWRTFQRRPYITPCIKYHYKMAGDLSATIPAIFKINLQRTAPLLHTTSVTTTCTIADLTLVCPCIVSIIVNDDQQDATILDYFFIPNQFYMFRAMSSSVIRSTWL